MRHTRRGLNRSGTSFTQELLIRSEKLTCRFHNSCAVEFSLSWTTRPVSHYLQKTGSDVTRASFHIICLLHSDAQPSLHLFLEVGNNKRTVSVFLPSALCVFTNMMEVLIRVFFFFSLSFSLQVESIWRRLCSTEEKKKGGGGVGLLVVSVW